ncbi:hypothetical protein OCOJLMKI_1511 [Methylobacterium iners]|uniref:Uncharacterized protein n=1 Tax=Methylobacterium iners TaxID=418707 RepID=A0ABQ4RVQ8_9HYPH|nr:hypothetical protein OCOJLMKI_1511 [Methylobacterium iners]
MHDLGDLDLKIDELADRLADGVDALVEAVLDEGVECGSVVALENAQKVGHRLVGKAHGGLSLDRAAFLVLVHVGSGISRPLRLDAAARFFDGLSSFRPCQVAVAHLVGGIDDVDRVHVGHDLEVAQWHDAIGVDRFHPGIRRSRRVAADRGRQNDAGEQATDRGEEASLDRAHG